MRLFLIILAGGLVSPAIAKEKCTSMCHFFDAWALAKICPNLALNEDGIKTDKAFGDLKTLKSQSLQMIRLRKDGCNIDCKWNAEAPDVEGTPCQYLKLK